MIKKLSILIPVFNEANTIYSILEKIKYTQLLNNIDREIIIVNDCSTDNTLSIINKYKEKNAELEIKVFSLEYNQGKVLQFIRELNMHVENLL